MSHSHRTMEERIRIEVFVSEGLSCRNIARCLGRHHTTLVCASRGKAALLTCHERTSRFLLLAEVENKTAASFNAALLAPLCELPRALPQSLTLDNGPEMAGFRELESIAGLRTYFCKPHAPWPRGTNENEGGLLRQYFPRGSSFYKITEEILQRVAKRLNNRPRKCVHYQTPAEVFNHARTGAFAI